MSYLPSEAKYTGETKTYYIVYELPVKVRGGHRRTRRFVKRVYISGKLLKWSRGKYKNRFGRTVYGVKFVYENPVRSYVAHRGSTRYKVGRKTVVVSKVVAIPKGAKKVKVVTVPPRDTLMDVA